MNENEKVIIGRTLRVDIPDLGLERFYAKVDTGAYRSSLHCEYIKIIEIDGKEVLEFQPIDSTRKVLHYNEYTIQEVLSSSGHLEKRFCVQLDISAKGVSVRSDVTLSDRSNHKVDLLLGRTFLNGNFLIDTSLYAKPRTVGRKKT